MHSVRIHRRVLRASLAIGLILAGGASSETAPAAATSSSAQATSLQSIAKSLEEIAAQQSSNAATANSNQAIAKALEDLAAQLRQPAATAPVASPATPNVAPALAKTSDSNAVTPVPLAPAAAPVSSPMPQSAIPAQTVAEPTVPVSVPVQTATPVPAAVPVPVSQSPNPVASESRASSAPEVMNVVYLHPVALVATVISSATPLDMTSLQIDCERSVIPHLSGIATVSKSRISTSRDGMDIDISFFDILAGVRWYPFQRFAGFYLQPTLDYNEATGNAQDFDHHAQISQDRFGGMFYLGTKHIWGHFTMDWNIGIGYLPWDNTYTTKRTGTELVNNPILHTSMSETYTRIETETFPDKMTGYIGLIAGTPQIGANFALGWAF